MASLFEHYRTFEGHTGSVYALAKGSNEGEFITAGADGIIALWNVDQENAQAVAKLPHKIFCLDLIDERTIVAGTSSGGIYIIDLTQHKPPRNIQYDTSICYNILSLNQGLFLTTQESGKLILWDANQATVLKSITLSDQKLRGLAASNSEVFLGSGDGKIIILDRESLKVKNELQAHKPGFGVNCIMVRESFNQLISGGKDGFLNFWNLDTLYSTQKNPAHNYALYELSAMEKNPLLASCSRDKSIKIWDSTDASFKQKIVREKQFGHLHSVNRVLWLSENVLVSVGDDKKVIAWTKTI